MYQVYSHKNKTTGKYYIGYSIYGMTFRWDNHCSYARKGSTTYFHKAIRKYGELDWESIILIEVETENEAKVNEVKFIERYKSNQRGFGYNMTPGGDGCSNKGRKLNPEHKEKAIAGLRKHKWTKEEYSERGKKNIGRKINDKGRKNISEGIKKQKAEGLTDAQKLALYNLHESSRGMKRTTETKEKQRLASIGKSKPKEQAIKAGKLSGEARMGKKRGSYKKKEIS